MLQKRTCFKYSLFESGEINCSWKYFFCIYSISSFLYNNKLVLILQQNNVKRMIHWYTLQLIIDSCQMNYINWKMYILGHVILLFKFSYIKYESSILENWVNLFLQSKVFNKPSLPIFTDTIEGIFKKKLRKCAMSANETTLHPSHTV